jgi:hypothetical protein
MAAYEIAKSDDVPNYGFAVIEISKGKKSSCFAATELFMPWIVFAPIKESLETDYRELMWAPWVSVRLEEWRGRRL